MSEAEPIIAACVVTMMLIALCLGAYVLATQIAMVDYVGLIGAGLLVWGVIQWHRNEQELEKL